MPKERFDHDLGQVHRDRDEGRISLFQLQFFRCFRISSSGGGGGGAFGRLVFIFQLTQHGRDAVGPNAFGATAFGATAFGAAPITPAVGVLIIIVVVVFVAIVFFAIYAVTLR